MVDDPARFPPPPPLTAALCTNFHRERSCYSVRQHGPFLGPQEPDHGRGPARDDSAAQERRADPSVASSLQAPPVQPREKRRGREHSYGLHNAGDGEKAGDEGGRNEAGEQALQQGVQAGAKCEDEKSGEEGTDGGRKTHQEEPGGGEREANSGEEHVRAEGGVSFSAPQPGGGGRQRGEEGNDADSRLEGREVCSL